MKKYIKLSMIAAVCTVSITGLSIAAQPKVEKAPGTLVDYLNDKGVSHLIVNSGRNARLTTYGWQDAEKSCKTIRSAGFNVTKIRNYAPESRNETVAVCKN